MGNGERNGRDCVFFCSNGTIFFSNIDCPLCMYVSICLRINNHKKSKKHKQFNLISCVRNWLKEIASQHSSNPFFLGFFSFLFLLLLSPLFTTLLEQNRTLIFSLLLNISFPFCLLVSKEGLGGGEEEYIGGSFGGEGFWKVGERWDAVG